MEKQSSQINLEERCERYGLLAGGISHIRIARRPDRHPSATGQKLRRGGLIISGYQPRGADHMPRVHRLRGSKTDRRSLLKVLIPESFAFLTALQWMMERSPEQIVGRLRLERSSRTASVDIICPRAYRCADRWEGARKLLIYGKPRRAGKIGWMLPIPSRVPFPERPLTATDRGQTGHGKGGLIRLGGLRKVLLTMTGPANRLLLARKLPDRKKVRKTVTFRILEGNSVSTTGDPAHAEVLLRPAQPMQRCAIENTHRLLRRSLPRKAKFNDRGENDIDDIVWTHNTTQMPRILNSHEAFAEHQDASLDT